MVDSADCIFSSTSSSSSGLTFPCSSGVDIQLETTNVSLVGVLQVRDYRRQVGRVGFPPLDPHGQTTHPAVLGLEATNQAAVSDSLPLEERDHQALLRGYVCRHQLGQPPQRLDPIPIRIADPIELVPNLIVTTSKKLARIHTLQLPTRSRHATPLPFSSQGAQIHRVCLAAVDG